MSNYIGRTMEVSGFWLAFEPHSIWVRTAPGSPYTSHTVEVRFDDMSDARMDRNIRDIAVLINMGAVTRGNSIRQSLGIQQHSGIIYADQVFTYNLNRRVTEIVPGPNGFERIPWKLTS